MIGAMDRMFYRRSMPALLRKLRHNRVAVMMLNVVVLSGTANLLLFCVAAWIDICESSLWFMCLSASSMLFIADMGMSYALSRHIAKHRLTEGRADIGSAGPAILRYVVRRTILPFVVLSIGLGVYIYFGRQQSVDTTESIGTVILLWGLIAAYMYFAGLAKLLQMANEGLGRLADERLIVSICQIATFVVAIGALFATRELWVVAAAYLAGFAVQAAWLYRNMRPDAEVAGTSITGESLEQTRHESRKLWHLNILTLISQNAQVMSLAFLANPASIAAFFFMQRLDSGATNLIAMIPIVDRSRITYHLGRGEYDQARAMIHRNLKLVIAVTALGALALVAVVTVCNRFELLRFHISWPLLGLFCIDMVFASILGACGQYVLATGDNRFMPWSATCAILTVGLQFVLVPRFGPEGAIAAFVIAQAATVYVANIRYMLQALRAMRMPVPT